MWSSMSAEDWFEVDDITRDEALRELRRHGADVGEFDADVKPDALGYYTGEQVLRWLGY